MSTFVYHHLSPAQQKARAAAEHNEQVAKGIAYNAYRLLEPVHDTIDNDHKGAKNPLPSGKARRAYIIDMGEKVIAAYRLLYEAADVCGDSSYRVEANAILDFTISDKVEKVVDKVIDNKALTNTDKVCAYEAYKVFVTENYGHELADDSPIRVMRENSRIVVEDRK